jgi:lysozyme
MDMSERGARLLIDREGSRTKAYRDSVGIWTIGVGHTAAAGPPKPHEGMTLTELQVRDLLTHDLVQYENAVELAIKRPMTQCEFDAMVSLCFNIGIGAFKRSSVVKLFNEGRKSDAADAFRMWNKAGGKVVRGLVNRRESEREQFLGR